MGLIGLILVIAIIILIMMVPIVLPTNCYCQPMHSWQKGCTKYPPSDPRCQKMKIFTHKLEVVQLRIVKVHEVLPGRLVPSLDVKQEIDKFEESVINPVGKPSDKLKMFENITVNVADAVMGEACKLFNVGEFIQQLIENMCCVIVSGGECTPKNKELCSQIVQMYIKFVRDGYQWAIDHFKKIINAVRDAIPPYVKDIITGVVDKVVWLQNKLETWSLSGYTQISEWVNNFLSETARLGVKTVNWAGRIIVNIAEKGENWARKFICNNVTKHIWARKMVDIASESLKFAVCGYSAKCSDNAAQTLAEHYYGIALGVSLTTVGICYHDPASDTIRDIKKEILTYCPKYPNPNDNFWKSASGIWTKIWGDGHHFNCPTGNAGYRSACATAQVSVEWASKITKALGKLLTGAHIINCDSSKTPCHKK